MWSFVHDTLWLRGFGLWLGYGCWVRICVSGSRLVLQSLVHGTLWLIGGLDYVRVVGVRVSVTGLLGSPVDLSLRHIMVNRGLGYG